MHKAPTYVCAVKITVGRPRPGQPSPRSRSNRADRPADLLDRCQPIADAANLIPYGLATATRVCTTLGSKELNDGFRSFPSGPSLLQLPDEADFARRSLFGELCGAWLPFVLPRRQGVFNLTAHEPDSRRHTASSLRPARPFDQELGCLGPAARRRSHCHLANGASCPWSLKTLLTASQMDNRCGSSLT